MNDGIGLGTTARRQTSEKQDDGREEERGRENVVSGRLAGEASPRTIVRARDGDVSKREEQGRGSLRRNVAATSAA